MTLSTFLALLPVGTLVAAVGIGTGSCARPWPAMPFIACHPPNPRPLWRLAATVALHLLKCPGPASADHDAS